MKNYKFLLAIFLLIFTILANAQVRTKFNNPELITVDGKFKKNYKESVFNLVLPSDQKISDIEKADSELTEDRLLRIAIPIGLDIDFVKQASWINDMNFSYGRLTINAANAKSLSLNFNKFLLPEGTEMYIYNENGNMVTGPITAQENNKNKIWGSSIYEGGKLTIEVKIPLNTKDELLLNISNVAYGYKKVFYDRIYGFGQSESCNINVLCPLGNAYQQEKYSVALLLMGNGGILASGAMVNNTCNLNIPYFLTANHVYLSDNNVAQWRFVFQYWSPQCTPSQDDLSNILFNGSTLRANNALSDFCLVELNQTPDISTNITYAGWNNGLVANAGVAGIHHPDGDVMKISQDNNPIIRSGGNVYNNATHWEVHWTQGITASGSSGSPLFDNNRRIIGQLHGGTSLCATPNAPDWYGSFDVSWSGGTTNATRLSNWLDPSNSGATTTNTTNVANLYARPPVGSYLPITGNSVVCGSSQTYTISGVAPTATVVWQLKAPIAAGGDRLPLQNVCTISSASNQATLTKVANGNVQLFATITNCGGFINYASADVTFGVPAAYYNGGYWKSSSFQPLTGTINTTDSKTVWVNMAYSTNTNNRYTWYKTSGSSNATWNVYNGYAGYGVNINFTPPVTSSSYFGMSITTTNICGTTTNPVVIYYSGPGIYMISPNPVSTDLNIEAVTTSNNNSSLITKNNITTSFDRIEVVDKMGYVVLSKSYPRNTKKANLNVSLLHSDVYIVRIFNGNISEQHKIIVQH